MTDSRLLSREWLYKGKLEAVRDTIELPNGRRANHETTLHPGAVVILPLVRPGVVLVLRQYRHSVGRRLYEFPAGTLEAGEPPELCAGRELIEETRYAAAQMKSLGVVYPAPGFCNEKQHFFFASGLTPSTEGTPDDDEMIEVEEWSVTKFEEAIRSGALEDGKSLAIFVRARLLGLL